MNLKNSIKNNVKNILGKKTSRQLVVIYVDDYGSIRMRNKESYNVLLKAGLPVNKTRYGYDTLCTTEDLNMLFDVLTSVKDKNGNNACFTPFVNIANPNFERISDSNFQTYYREPFTLTMEKLGKAYNGAYELWKQGISEGIFIPEYHGTEHLSVWRFMKALRENHKSTRLAFDNGSVCMPTFEGEKYIENDTAPFDIIKKEDNEILKEDIKVGLKMFHDLLGFSATQFTPGAGIYSPSLHRTLLDNGIKDIHVERYESYPLGDGLYQKKFIYTGKKNEIGQNYIVRNCPFECYYANGSRNNNVVSFCLDNIEAAFRWHAPALISTHRVNFAGAIEPTHRDDSLRSLKILLDEILRRWPNVEFVSANEMSKIVFK